MNSFIEYEIKAAISLMVLYLFYWLFLKRDTNFRLNRVILLFSLIVSMIIPAVSSSIIKTPLITENLPVFNIDFGNPVSLLSSDTQISAESTIHLSSWRMLYIIYIVGALIVFARLIYQAIFIKAISHLSKKASHDGFTIISMSTDMVPFSYFRKIFIPNSRIDDTSFDSIIAHEKSHMSQGHYADLFIIEIITVLQWFNPIVWMYEKSVKEVHEYLADEAVLNSGKSRGQYQALLVNQAMGGPVFILTNQFNQSLIKKRIMMMRKIKTPHVAQLKALLIVPLIAGLLLVFATPQMNGQPVQDGKQLKVTGNVTDLSTGMPLPGCSIVLKGTTVGTVNDNDGNYVLKVNGPDDILIISNVGYRTQQAKVGANSVINVQMERDILKLDFAKGNRFVLVESKYDAGKEVDTNAEVFVVVEEMPAYPGGTDALLKFLQANMRYPDGAKAQGYEGEVTVSYIIDVNGNVRDAKIIRGLSPEIDAEALRLTNSILGWKPATQRGKPIPTTVYMPIEFRINK